MSPESTTTAAMRVEELGMISIIISRRCSHNKVDPLATLYFCISYSLGTCAHCLCLYLCLQLVTHHDQSGHSASKLPGVAPRRNLYPSRGSSAFILRELLYLVLYVRVHYRYTPYGHCIICTSGEVPAPETTYECNTNTTIILT